MNAGSVVRGLAATALTITVLSGGALLPGGAASSSPILSARCIRPVVPASVHPTTILPTPPDPCQGR